MQHHTHLTRPPHVRSVHTNNIQIHPAPVPPTQLQNSNTVPQSTNLRDHQNRLNKPPLATATHQTTQMQKIRQQHQPSSFKNINNNNNHSNNNNSYQQYNPINVQQQEQQPHMGVLQQSQHQTAHRNVPPMHHQQKQQQHNVLHMKNPLLQQQHPLQQLNKQKNHHQQQQYQTYSYAGSKIKYGNNSSSSSNNNNNKTNDNNNTLNATATNCSTPKAILQNPNRLLTKSTPTSATTKPIAVTTSPPKTTTKKILATEITATANSVGEAINSSKSIDILTSKQSQSAELTEVPSAENSTNVEEEKSSKEANKENNSSESKAKKSSSPSDQLQNSVLSNLDSTIRKNSKEKTPMCLVNELARYNKITHQYRLTGEKGPAHCKRFTVTLKLGDEEYTAEGFKIKKAQHLAAAQAIEKTAYAHPIQKGNRNNEDVKNRPYITPTVELNALAMKIGQPTYYLFDPRQMPSLMSSVSPADLVDVMLEGGVIPTHHYGGARPPMQHPATALGLGGHIMPAPPTHSRMMHDPPYGARRNYDLHGGIYPPPPPPPIPPPHMQHHNQRCYPPHRSYPPMHRYQRYPLLPPPPPPAGMPPAPHHMRPHFGGPATPYKITLIVGKQKYVGVGRTMQQAKHDAAARALHVLKAKTEDKSDEELDDSIDENDAKSPISQVHEAAVKREMQVHFKIMGEDGPAHMRNFITACIVGDIVTEGEGHGKKISKKRAAEKMLLELEKLPPLTPIKSPIRRIKAKTTSRIPLSPSDKIDATGSGGGRRGKRYNLLNTSKDIEKSEDDNESPITKLLNIQQNLKEKEPVFELLSKNGLDKPKRREFIVEVTAQGKVARGTGRSKKQAKRNAAENMLNILAESSKEKSDENATEEITNEKFVNIASSSMINAVNLTENLEQKSINTTNEKPRAAMNTIRTIDIPIVSTSAGQVPGILILRQNKKTPKKKETTAATTDPVKPTEIETKKTNASVLQAAINITDIKTAAVPETVATTPSIQQCIETTTTTSSTALVDTPSNTTMTTTTTANTSTTAVKSSNNNSSSSSNGNSSSSSNSALPMMKHQLLYLAKLLGFEVDFSDYPKGNHNEFLTIVTLSTDPPQICHGFGTSTNESQNDAARNALKILSDLGLNNAKSN